MEIHRQTCQNCGSRELRNIIVRDYETGDKVFVRCGKCKKLVARYIIANRGYYHHGKGFESYLRGLNRGGCFMSGKSIKSEFEKITHECLEEFEGAVEWLTKLEEFEGAAEWLEKEEKL